MTGLSNVLAGTATLMLGLGVPVAANATHLKHRHHHLAPIVAPPPPVASIYDNPLYVPERNDPDFGSTPADGLELGRERPLLSSEDVVRQFGVTPAPGFEIEGPPIGASLPVIR